MRRKTRAQIASILARHADRLVFDGLSREIAGAHASRLLIEICGDIPPPEVDAPGPASTTLGAQVRVVLDQYRALYREVTGLIEDPRITAADRATLGQLLKAYGPQVVQARLEAFAHWDDRFIRGKVGFSITGFYRFWNTLATTVIAAQQSKTQPPSDCEHVPRCPTRAVHSQKFLADVKKSSEPT